MDIRQYQRGYDDDSEYAYYPTKKGFRIPEREFRRVVQQYALMPETYVHPLIVKRSFPLLHGGQFESAVLQAYKAIETAVRARIAAGPEDFGVKLLRRAFHPDSGPLSDPALPRGEREAFSNYIAGAFGYYRNPCSHRDVAMDFVEAFERLVIASDLLKAVERALKETIDGA